MPVLTEVEGSRTLLSWHNKVHLLTDEGFLVENELDTQVKPVCAELLDRIAAFTEGHNNTDVLLIYFAGHGFRSPDTGKDYLAPLDVEREILERSAIRVHEVLDRIKTSGARQGVLILDMCRNVAGRGIAAEDEGIGEETLKQAKAKGVWVLNSCQPGKTTGDPKEGGFYTRFLIEGIEGAADGFGDHKKDGLITIREAYEYAEENVVAYTRAHPPVQIPCHSEFDVVRAGEMVLAVTDLPPTATLIAAGAPQGADVLVDGIARGTLPCQITVDLVGVGEKQVEVTIRKAGFQDQTKRVMLQPGIVVRLQTQLGAATRPPPRAALARWTAHGGAWARGKDGASIVQTSMDPWCQLVAGDETGAKLE